MTETATAPASLDRDAVEALAARFGDPEWLLKRRLEAWRLFEEAPMPDALSEEWRRTDVSKISLDGLAPFAPPRKAIEGVGGLPPELAAFLDENEELAGRIVQHDSDVVYETLSQDLAAKGVIVASLQTAAREHEEIVRDSLFTAVTPAEWKFLGLHGALWSGGCLVYVPKGVEVELPIEYVVGLTAERTGIFPHLLIIAEANSSVTVIQEDISSEIAGFVSGAVEVIAREGSNVRFVDVQRLGKQVQNFTTMRALLSKDASFQGILLGLGGELTKTRLDVRMDGEGSETELLGLFFGDDDQHFSYYTRQDHVAPRTESDLLFKSVLDDSASFIWNGVVEVRKGAGESAANQTNRNLLLSDKASASPTPILEISAYDVARCSHAATVGPVDDELIFYMQSRGIPANEAQEMLVDGFFSEVLDRVPSERVQDRVRAVLDTKLGR